MLQAESKRAAFTLIELLVVVAIIALLIAILLPSLAMARELSRRSACCANLHALALAHRTYAAEFDDRLPNLNAPNSVTASGATATLVLLYNNYAHDPKVFHCPSDPDPMPHDITSGDWLVANTARVSYDYYTVYWLPEHGPRAARIDQAPLVWDQDGGIPKQDILQNHGYKGGNVGFVDGHAEWQPVKDWDGNNWPHPADQYYW